MYCIELFYIRLKIILLHIHITFIIPCENSGIITFASSKIEKTLVLPALSKFTVKLIC